MYFSKVDGGMSVSNLRSSRSLLSRVFWFLKAGHDLQSPTSNTKINLRMQILQENRKDFSMQILQENRKLIYSC